VRAEDLQSGKLIQGDPDGTRWAPAEVDTVNVSPHYWFWKSTSERKLRSLDDLIDCYYRSVGHGCVLILNQTPDTTGLIPEADAKRAAEFGAEVARRFGKPIAAKQGKGEIVELQLAGTTTVDHIVTMEDITGGERIRQYVLQGEIDGHWKELCHGTAIGHKKIDRIKPVKVEAVRLICLESAAQPLIRTLAVYDTTSTSH
jgi:alpha-L-fucosidase